MIKRRIAAFTFALILGLALTHFFGKDKIFTLNAKIDCGAMAQYGIDDTEAVNECMDRVVKAGGGRVLFPLGTYHLKGRLRFPERTAPLSRCYLRLQGEDGSVIFSSEER